ncbi:transcriptional regulator, AraC family [Cyclonatronum proteinivorum]|uniref:Transcriptional regulator, AraC family n=1 Tax=Cyclonatronum proteinivorum TaxID=1457365 RepID=A0A345UK93_9BACT|nr:helix-turn-helix domain-containing protein [Cyclonatronum proteinivorum]AXJ00895.1 transcriptional regulator, AraC family [Cyclonatronum proteinivorum]
MQQQALIPDFRNRKPEKLVENRTTYAGTEALFSIYDTYQPAERVELHAPSVMFCGMVTGRKIIHIPEQDSFDFLPGESLVLHPNQTIHIDFPDARFKEPTSCITLEIPVTKIRQVADLMNEQCPKLPEHSEWSYDEKGFIHFANNRSVDLVIQKLSHLFTESNANSDFLVDINTTELVVHMMQSQSRGFLLSQFRERSNSDSLSMAIAWMHDNAGKIRNIEEVAERACMSKSSFYRHFKAEMGQSPLDYLNEIRVRQAKKMLLQPGTQVADVSFSFGYSSVSHFIRTFKKETGLTPKQYVRMKKALQAGSNAGQ